MLIITTINAFNGTGDLKGIGETMNTCWEHKKLMAPGCEPKICRTMIDAIEPLAYGNRSVFVKLGGGR